MNRTAHNRFILAALLLLAYCVSAPAAARTSPTLPNLSINAFAQDDRGFVWIATDNGLCRYNGQNYLQFHYDPNTDSSLPSNEVLDVEKDRAGNIWAATNKAVCIYEPGSRTFRRLPVEGGGLRLCATDEGMACYGPRGIVFFDVSGNVLHRADSPLHRLTLLLRDDDGGLLGLNVDGIHISRLGTDGEIVCTGEVEGAVSFVSASTDGNGRIWIAGESGLSIIDCRDFTPVRDDRYDRIISFVGDRKVGTVFRAGGRMFLCIPALNIYSCNIANGNFARVDAKKFDLNFTSDFSCGFCDSDGSVWVGTKDRGFGVELNTRRTFLSSTALKRTTANKYINSASSAPGSSLLWMASYYKGLLVFDTSTQTGRWYNYNKDKEIASVGERRINMILADSKGKLWINMEDRLAVCGTDYMQLLSPQFKLDGVRVNSFLETEGGRVWAGTQNGLYLWEDYGEKAHLFPDYAVMDVVEDCDGALLVAVEGSGLFRLDIATLSMEKLDFPEEYGMYALQASCLLPQKDGGLWIGSQYDGLLHRGRDGEYRAYSTQDGLGSNEISSLAEDSDGNVWVGTSYGLSLVSHKYGKPITYYRGSWLETQQFLHNSVAQVGGKLAFGGNDGTAFFSPRQIISNISEDSLPLVLDELTVNGVSQCPGGGILVKTFDDTDRIVLKRKQNNIDIVFETISYISDHSQIEASYRLRSGHDDDAEWVDLGNHRRISLSNLPSGHYRMDIRLRNADGFWSDPPRSLDIVVEVSPWLSWYAVLIYLLLAALAIWATMRIIVRRRLEGMELRYAKEELDREKNLSQMKENFFTNISHELRTYLTLIYGPVNLLPETSDSGKLKRISESINFNMRKLLDLVDQLLNLSRMENDALPLFVTEQDTWQYIQRTVESFRYAAQQKDISLQMEGSLGQEEGRKLPLDYDKLSKILSNLLSNALKYTDSGGHVKVRVSCTSSPDSLLSGMKESSEYLEISVLDDGIGMAPEDIPQVFNRYARLSRSEKTAVGSGIGLHYVQALLRTHGGAVSARVRPTGGMEFIFAIPVDSSLYEVVQQPVEVIDEMSSNPEALPIEPDGGSDPSGDERRTKVLIVEDNPELQAYCRSELGRYYDVSTANDGLEGLDMVNDLMPDVVITDVMMPRLDGLEFCRRIKQDPMLCHIPVIILTAKTGEKDKLAGYRYGADLYITKPFTAELLRTVIENIISTRERMRRMVVSSESLPKKSDEAVEMAPQDRQFIDSLRAFLDENLSGGDVSVSTIADHLCMSRASFFRKMKSLTGMTPNDFVLSYRLNKAAAMLLKGELRINEISDLVGFSSPSHFSRTFKQHFGKSPKEYTLN